MVRVPVFATLALTAAMAQTVDREPPPPDVYEGGGAIPTPEQRVFDGSVTGSGRIVLEDGGRPPVAPLVWGATTVFANGTFTFQQPQIKGGARDAIGAIAYAEIHVPGFRIWRGALYDGIVVVLKRLGENEGSTVSVSQLKAPPKARRAYEEGLAKEWKGMHRAAKRRFQEATALYPQYAAAWGELGLVLERMGRPVEAELAYERAIDADWKYLKPYLRLASLRAHFGRWFSVIQITDVALQLSPVEFPGIYFYRAAAQFNLKQFLDAEATVRVAIDLDTDRGFPQSHYLLGRILEMKHDFGGAIEQMKKCLALAPKAPDAPEIRKRIADIETRL